MFVPKPDYYGYVDVTYTLVNEWGDTSHAIASWVVTNVPDKPVAVDDNAATAQENMSVDILNVVGNDTDADNWPAPQAPNFGLTVASVTAEGGIAAINSTGKGIVFTPNANWNSDRNPGAFSVTYKVKDAEGNVSDNEVTIPITVTPKNAKPRARGTDGAGAIDLQEGSVGTLSTVDGGGEGDEYANQALSYTVVTQPTSGTVTPDGAGGWTFTASDLDYNGSDSFGYAVTDDAGAGEVASLTSDSVIVGLNIVHVNDPPIANGDEQTTDEDTPVSFTLTGADGDPMNWENQTLTFAIVAGPAHGTLSGFNPATGAVTYTPDPNWNTVDPNNPGQHIPDSFTVIVTDDNTCGGDALTSEPATVTITVNPVNDAPDAIDDGVGAIAPGQSATFDVLANDFDVDGDTLTIISVTDGAYGTVVNNGNGTVTYTADPEFPNNTFDYFTYTISDGHGGTDTATKGVNYSGSALMAAPSISRSLPTSGAPIEAGNEGISLLTPAALESIIEAGKQRWANVGANVSVLAGANFQVADLPGDHLAIALSGTVLIDRDAAGFGWFVDATPGNDREFVLRVARTELWATANSRAFGRMDLLTAVMHEMGHLMGLEHAADGSHSVMEDTLATGVRRVPSWFDLAAGLTGRRGSSSPTEAFFSGYGQEG